MRTVRGGPASRCRVAFGRRVALAAAAIGLLAVSIVAAAHGEDPPGDPAIPPGQEQLVAAMLGRGAGLPCTLLRAGVAYTVIQATYLCPRGAVTLELAHPRYATASSVQTGRFAVTVRRGSPPPGFPEALASLVRSREESFAWSWPAADGDVGDDSATE